MADYWSSAEDTDDAETAKYMNKIKKIVCSKTLKTADWNNSTIVKDAVYEIAQLKKQGNGNLFVFGSAKLSQFLINAGLFDEYRLCIAPVFLGAGRRLFSDGLPYQKLKLVKVQKLQSSGVILIYSARTK